VALQAGGGAAGLLIVEDEPGAVPPEVEAMAEMPLMLTFVEAGPADLQSAFNGAFWASRPRPLLLANGLVAPTWTVAAGAWYRLRICYNTVGHRLLTLALAQTDTGDRAARVSTLDARRGS